MRLWIRYCPKCRCLRYHLTVKTHDVCRICKNVIDKEPVR